MELTKVTFKTGFSSILKVNFGHVFVNSLDKYLFIDIFIDLALISSQLTVACWKAAIETLKKRCEICSKVTRKTPEWRQWRRSDVFNVNFEHVLHLFLIFLLLIFDKELLAGFIVHSEWVFSQKERLQLLDFFLLRRGDYIPQILLLCQHEKLLWVFHFI